MPIDIYFFNSLAQFLMLIVLMVIIFVQRKAFGVRAVFIGIEALLLTVLLRRVSEIGLYFGVVIFDRMALTILSWIVIFILIFASWQAYRRGVLIRHIEGLLKKQEHYDQALHENGEKLTLTGNR